MRGWTGDRQVANAKYALQHNVGLGGAVVITIYKKANKKQSAPKTAYNPAVEARPITKEDFALAASQKANRAEYMDSVGVAKL